MKRLLLRMLSAFLLLAPYGHGGTHVFHYHSDLGVASDRPGFTCLTIANRNLSIGQPVFLVVLSPQQAIVQAKVERSLSKDCMGGDAAQSTMASYELSVVKGTLPPAAPAIAAVNPVTPLRTRGDSVVSDLEGKGQLDYFRQCTSSEGVHLTVWAGKPLTGKRLWHQYYYLGYDVEPNCSEKETVDDHP